jgi:hypothetical protein
MSSDHTNFEAMLSFAEKPSRSASRRGLSAAGRYDSIETQAELALPLSFSHPIVDRSVSMAED